ncbi:quinolinate synthase NadA [Candidatus Aerophobetes bacterium]|nr:quinolinate synthase NadA [Candidatus Aerophobetes bacterium]
MEKEKIIEQIKKLKKEKKAIILAHNYQIGEIQDIADFVGDSLELSKKAAGVSCRIIVFCGVRFMAETAKILSPEKKVLLPKKEAGCPLADMIKAEEARKLKQMYPDAEIVAYVNTNAEVKAESDICCTSANAVEVARKIKVEKIIFVPDKNLASYVAKNLPEKRIIPFQGYCYVHDKIKKEDIAKAKENHPDAKVIVHPECRPEVIEIADMVASTGGMIRFAKESSAKKFIIGTEEGIIHRLKKENPEKEFFPIFPLPVCKDMKLTTLEDVYLALKEERYEIEIEESIRKKAKKALDRMLQ